MSDKDRAKKDHMGKDKKNKAMRERENPRTQRAEPRQQAKDVKSQGQEQDSGAD